MKHKWVPKEKISRHLPMAVIASEDNRFASHNGFDFKEISKAIEENKKRKKARGASTISHYFIFTSFILWSLNISQGKVGFVFELVDNPFLKFSVASESK